MPQDIIGVDEFPLSIVIPADSDPADLTYIKTMAQGLANQTMWLRNRIFSYQSRMVYGGLRAGSITVTNVPPSGVTVLPWDSDLPHSPEYLPVANALRAPVPGNYEVTASLVVSGGPGLCVFRFAINGVNTPAPIWRVELESDRRSLHMSSILSLSGGDLVTLRAFSTLSLDLEIDDGTLIMRAL